MITEDTAEKIHEASLRAVVELPALLRDVEPRCSGEDFQKIKRGVGLTIGTIQAELLDPLYVEYPELDDLR